MQLASMPRVPRRSIPAYAVAATVAVGGVGAVLSLAEVDHPAVGPLTLVFLAIAPAAAVCGLVGGDRIATLIAGFAGTIAVNGVVAEAMLILGTWSPRGGVVAVAAISALCVAVRLLTGLRTVTSTEA